VLGAIALAQRPLTVPQIARRVGLTRQSVHATVGPLVRDGLLALAPNADHRRFPLVCLTEPGRATYSAIDRRQAAWVNRLAGGIDRADLETTARVLEELCRRLEADDAEDTPVAAEKEETMPTAPEPMAPTEAAEGRRRSQR
jgi:DNA-binding MarR family transcriptional regulator